MTLDSLTAYCAWCILLHANAGASKEKERWLKRR